MYGRYYSGMFKGSLTVRIDCLTDISSGISLNIELAVLAVDSLK
jgi:hypothetical protein